MTAGSIEVRRASDSDGQPLAALHTASLPSSLLSMLGPIAVVRYYAFVVASPTESVWTALDGGRVVGGCVLSTAPDTVLRRFARHAPLSLARETVWGLVRSAELRRRVASRFRGSTSDGPHVPEVTQIFTESRSRGHGIGGQLLRACETALASEHVRRYFVHTLRDDNDAGIRFYRREGFVPIGESRSFGEAFVIMQKELS